MNYPCFNGFIERMVGEFKKLLLKVQETDTDCHLVMMLYRATSLSTKHNYSAELPNGRLIWKPLVPIHQLGVKQTRDTKYIGAKTKQRIGMKNEIVAGIHCCMKANKSMSRMRKPNCGNLE